ncbi:TetR/AcrR family transcriptional regulator [Lentibacillus sp. CBA3610]|uniref:TetR/AcrR family transcriptional regulator n=1 Tax=Lentibacillus sp. CBA3610 TaxID=2518176 RepID=UPI001595780F|nr:TetR/AcrR family transcriptional regulator [Lentibacillus sp. CBA3610]QKY69840.1 TetR/AcrR family transcriptional regulator [Lentibacillus sp. CBA3610]
MPKTTRDKIIQAALSSFAARGYDGTTLARIARDVGIQKPSLYNHFSSKDELFFTVAKKVMEELTEVMMTSANLHQEKAVEDRIYLVLTDSTDFILQKHEGAMYKRFMLFPPAGIAEDLQILNQAGDANIDQLLMNFYEQGVNENVLNDCSFPVFRAGFYILMDGLFTESFIYRDGDFQERFEGAWMVFWRGVSGVCPSPL